MAMFFFPFFTGADSEFSELEGGEILVQRSKDLSEERERENRRITLLSQYYFVFMFPKNGVAAVPSPPISDQWFVHLTLNGRVEDSNLSPAPTFFDKTFTYLCHSPPCFNGYPAIIAEVTIITGPTGRAEWILFWLPWVTQL